MSDRTQAHVLVSMQFVLFGLLAAGVLLFPRQSSMPVLMIGAVTAVLGAVVGLLAIAQHAASNAVMPKITPEPNTAAELVQSGLYRFVRHPIYSGVLLVGWGAALAHGHPVLLLGALVLTLFFSYKSLFEERLLRQVYPDYARYMQQTGRFLPLWVKLWTYRANEHDG